MPMLGPRVVACLALRLMLLRSACLALRLRPGLRCAHHALGPGLRLACHDRLPACRLKSRLVRLRLALLALRALLALLRLGPFIASALSVPRLGTAAGAGGLPSGLRVTIRVWLRITTGMRLRSSALRVAAAVL
jgi:hypothetical protein